MSIRSQPIAPHHEPAYEGVVIEQYRGPLLEAPLPPPPAPNPALVGRAVPIRPTETRRERMIAQRAKLLLRLPVAATLCSMLVAIALVGLALQPLTSPRMMQVVLNLCFVALGGGVVISVWSFFHAAQAYNPRRLRRLCLVLLAADVLFAPAVYIELTISDANYNAAVIRSTKQLIIGELRPTLFRDQFNDVNLWPDQPGSRTLGYYTCAYGDEMLTTTIRLDPCTRPLTLTTQIMDDPNRNGKVVSLIADYDTPSGPPQEHRWQYYFNRNAERDKVTVDSIGEYLPAKPLNRTDVINLIMKMSNILPSAPGLYRDDHRPAIPTWTMPSNGLQVSYRQPCAAPDTISGTLMVCNSTMTVTVTVDGDNTGRWREATFGASWQESEVTKQHQWVIRVDEQQLPNEQHITLVSERGDPLPSNPLDVGEAIAQAKLAVLQNTSPPHFGDLSVVHWPNQSDVEMGYYRYCGNSPGKIIGNPTPDPCIGWLIFSTAAERDSAANQQTVTFGVLWTSCSSNAGGEHEWRYRITSERQASFLGESGDRLPSQQLPPTPIPPH